MKVLLCGCFEWLFTVLKEQHGFCVNRIFYFLWLSCQVKSGSWCLTLQRIVLVLEWKKIFRLIECFHEISVSSCDSYLDLGIVQFQGLRIIWYYLPHQFRIFICLNIPMIVSWYSVYSPQNNHSTFDTLQEAQNNVVFDNETKCSNNVFTKQNFFIFLLPNPPTGMTYLDIDTEPSPPLTGLGEERTISYSHSSIVHRPYFSSAAPMRLIRRRLYNVRCGK